MYIVTSSATVQQYNQWPVHASDLSQ